MGGWGSFQKQASLRLPLASSQDEPECGKNDLLAMKLILYDTPIPIAKSADIPNLVSVPPFLTNESSF